MYLIGYLILVVIVMMIIALLFSVAYGKNIFQDIKTKEPVFFVKHMSNKSIFLSLKSRLPWAIIFGKCRFLKNQELRGKCKKLRIIGVIYVLLCLLTTLTIFVNILVMHFHR